MTNQQLGRIEAVDLRQIWQHEANDFTPWLAGHLDLLGEALNLDLSLVESEGQVGPFAVDVVADSGSGLVVIENQLEQTDHSHLGQLLTYAAGRDAQTLIWITPQFRDEHRAALDWLNHWTSEEIEVYGVEVRAIRIGDSMPAPEFRPVAFPNTWSRQAGGVSSSRAASGDVERYREFYQPLIDEAQKRGWTNRSRASAVRHQSFPSTAPDRRVTFGLEFRQSRRNRAVTVSVRMATEDLDRNRAIYDALHSDREAIEAELGWEVEWVPLRRKAAYVRVVGEGSIDDTIEQQQATRDWMLETLGKLRDVFNPRLNEIIAELDAEEADGVGRSLSGDDL